MNGGQDLGGLHGFGKIVSPPGLPDYDFENYHADWEPRVMGMVVALGACGQWNIDISRHARENRPPDEYISSPYYKIWLEGVTTLLLDRNMVSQQELAEGKKLIPASDFKACLKPDNVWDSLHSMGGRADRPAVTEPSFAVGDAVHTVNFNPLGHTRLPRYARGRNGQITRVLGHHVFPDSSGNGAGDEPKWLYQVAFAAQELWGQQANPRDQVTLDLWEPYLERI